ncbi:MAG: hypothetical protein ABII76_16960 [Pseudomonadota bacterium]
MNAAIQAVQTALVIAHKNMKMDQEPWPHYKEQLAVNIVELEAGLKVLLTSEARRAAARVSYGKEVAR